MSKYISQYYNTYNLYLQTKLICYISLRELHLLLVSNTKWKTISIDFIVKLLESIRFNVVVNSVSKRAYFISTHTMVIVENTIRLFLHYV